MRHASELTSAQRNAIQQRLQPTTGYLIKLARRMQLLGWDPKDPVYAAAWKAHEAMVELRMAITYSGTGQGKLR